MILNIILFSNIYHFALIIKYGIIELIKLKTMFKKVNNLHLFFLVLITSVLSLLLIQNIVFAVDGDGDEESNSGWQNPAHPPGDINYTPPNIFLNPLGEDLNLGTSDIVTSGVRNISFNQNSINTGGYFIGNKEVLKWSDDKVEIPQDVDITGGNSLMIDGQEIRTGYFIEDIASDGSTFYDMIGIDDLRIYKNSDDKIFFVNGGSGQNSKSAIVGVNSNSKYAAIVGHGRYGVHGDGDIGVWGNGNYGVVASGIVGGMSVIINYDPNTPNGIISSTFGINSTLADFNQGSIGLVAKGGYSAVNINGTDYIYDDGTGFLGNTYAGLGLCAISGENVFNIGDGSYLNYCTYTGVSGGYNNYAAFFGGDTYQKGMFQLHHKLEDTGENLIYANAEADSVNGNLLLLQNNGVDKFSVSVEGNTNINGDLFVQGGLSSTGSIQSSDYIKIKTRYGDPVDSDCNQISERGKLMYNYQDNNLCVCDDVSGWRCVSTEVINIHDTDPELPN